MKFRIENKQEKQNFELVYRKDEYSFDIEPQDGSDHSSIMINELQLEIDHIGKISYVWGYCPLINYSETKEYPQNYCRNDLVVLLDEPPIPGVSHRLNKDKRWLIYINKKQGWVCIGTSEIGQNKLIEFAPNCIASFDKEMQFEAIWLKPRYL